MVQQNGDRERAVLEEKLNHMEKKTNEIMSLKSREIDQLREQNQISMIKTDDNYNVLKDELIISQNRVQELERVKNDLDSKYDKDIALWEGKCTFLEEIRDSLKKELVDTAKKYENVIDQLQQKPKDDSTQLKYQDIQK